MSARFQAIERPEGGDERGVLWVTRHGCPQALALRDHLDAVDELVFPVGYYGFDMPLNTAFEVESADPCGACGNTLRMWFGWKGPRIWIP